MKNKIEHLIDCEIEKIINNKKGVIIGSSALLSKSNDIDVCIHISVWTELMSLLDRDFGMFCCYDEVKSFLAEHSIDLSLEYKEDCLPLGNIYRLKTKKYDLIVFNSVNELKALKKSIGKMEQVPVVVLENKKLRIEIFNYLFCLYREMGAE